MTKKDKEQGKRFIKKAKELDSDKSGDLFERAFQKIIPQKESKSAPSNSPNSGEREY